MSLALTALSRFLAESSPALAAPGRRRVVASTARMIAASPALLACEREIIDGYTRSLATLLARETAAAPGDVQPWVAANALMGVHRALLETARRAALEGRSGPDLAAEVRSQAEDAFARLARGLGDYAVKAGPGRTESVPEPGQ